jgi:hypothetical protein
VVLFLNGAYWGLYNLMERKDKHFIKNNFGYDDIDMLESHFLNEIEGDASDWLNLLRHIEHNNIDNDDEFAYIRSKIDIPSLMDYWIFEIYTATHDYNVNIRMWRPRTPDGKWRWLAFDEDSWGKYEEPTVDEMTSETYAESVFIIGALLENKSFRFEFVNRFADLLNTVLQPDSVKKLIDEIQSVIKDEKQRDYDRWKNLVHFVEPGSQIAFLKEFAEKRPEVLRRDIADRFELPGTCTLTAEVRGAGAIKINTIRPAAFPWTGVYFQEVPIHLKALPDAGHQFLGWSDAKVSEHDSISLYLSQPRHKIAALFK